MKEKKMTYFDNLRSLSGLSWVSVLCYEDGLSSLDDDDTIGLFVPRLCSVS